MSSRDFVLIVVLMLVAFSQSGCASFNRKLKTFLGGSSQTSAQQASTMTKFSESQDVSPRVKRQYKRVTKESLADESALDAKAGSLWVMEGQGAYLFSQNIVRLVGDPLAVTLEGDPRDQLQSKVGVIKKLVAKIEEKQRLRQRGLAGEDGREEKEEKLSKKEKAEKEKKENRPRPPRSKRPPRSRIWRTSTSRTSPPGSWSALSRATIGSRARNRS
ncbi:MAG: hypothetical protein HC902_13565 [Calothrix sp. SM1_5_4]|nr:hypothetical protein [Calothrix sp. SM1_5_4]